MQSTKILTVIAITTTIFAYHFTREDMSPDQLQGDTSEFTERSTLNDQDKLDKLVSMFERVQKTQQEQVKKTQLQQERINKVLANLETRLKSVESEDGEQTIGALVSSGAGQSTDQKLQKTDSDKSKTQQVSEADIGHWMKESLSAGGGNEESTKLATNQAVKSLEKAPDVVLEDMQCDDRFCVAKFSHEDGDQPDIGNIFGEPPFMDGGFTVKESDGTLALYFAQPGESLDELRSEAEEFAFESVD